MGREREKLLVLCCAAYVWIDDELELNKVQCGYQRNDDGR